MDGWKTEKLKDLVEELVMGQSPDSSTYNYIGEGEPFIQGNADIKEGFPSVRMFTTDSKRYSEIDDILLAVRAPVGDIFYNNCGRLSIGRGLSAIRIKNSDLRNYVFHYLKYDKQQFAKLEQGTTFTEIGKKEVRNLKIFLPNDRAEQAAISKILSTVDEAIRCTNETIQKLERVKKSLMQNLLSGKMKPDGTMRTSAEFYEDEKMGLVPKGWKCVKLKDVVLRSGEYGANASAIMYEEGDVRFIRITDINDDGTLSNTDIVGLDNEIAKKYLLKEDDFLFARTGDTIGKSLLYKESMGLAAFAGYLIKFIFNKQKIVPELFQLIANSEIFEAFKISMKRVGAKPNINSREYGNFRFLIPEDKEEQKRIVDSFDPISKEIIRNNNKITTLELLKKSLMQQLLTGKVRVKL